MGYRMLPKTRRNFLAHRLFCQAIHGPRRRGHRILYLSALWGNRGVFQTFQVHEIRIVIAWSGKLDLI